MSALPAAAIPVAPQPLPLATPAGPLPWWQRVHIRDVAVFGVFAAIFAMALRPVIDPDLFWHLATGRFMWATGQIPPHADPFSWTVPGRTWIAHEWLTELVLYPLYMHGGYAALMLLFGAIISGAFAFSYATARRLGASRLIGVGITLLAAVASDHTWGVRPQMLSMLLMAITAWLLTPSTGTTAGASARLYVIERYRLQPDRLWVLPPLMILWANLHGGFIFGLALLGLVALGRTLEQRWPHRCHGIASDLAPVRFWRLLAICCLVCLLNPNGLAGVLYPFSYLGNNASTRYIAEWVSPDFHQTQYLFFEALLLLLIAGVTLARRRPGVIAVLLAVAFTYLALGSVRNINLFSVIVAPLIAASLTSAWQGRQRRLRAAVTAGQPVRDLQSRGHERLALSPGKSLLNVTLAAIIAVSVLVLSAPGLSAAHNTAMQARRFPAGAVTYLRTHRLKGHLLNSYDWGGYLIWTLYPRLRVYVDGRPDMYGDRYMDQFVRTWQAQSGWQGTLRRAGVDLVLVEPSSGLGRALAATPEWRVAYRDGISVLYVRRRA